MLTRITASLAVLLLAFSAQTSLAAGSNLKIGVVDWQKLWLAAPQKESIQQQLKNEFAPREDELRKLEEEFNALLDKARRDEPVMTGEQKLEAKRKLDEKKDMAERRMRELREDRERRAQQELGKLQLEIRDLVHKVAKAEGYDLILMQEAVVFMNDKADITEDVLAKMKK